MADVLSVGGSSDTRAWYRRLVGAQRGVKMCDDCLERDCYGPGVLYNGTKSNEEDVEVRHEVAARVIHKVPVGQVSMLVETMFEHRIIFIERCESDQQEELEAWSAGTIISWAPIEAASLHRVFISGDPDTFQRKAPQAQPGTAESRARLRYAVVGKE